MFRIRCIEKKTCRIWFVFSVVAGLQLCCVDGSGWAGPIVREPYLQLSTESSIVVVWRTKGPVEPVVRYGLMADTLDQRSSTEHVTLRVSDDIGGVEAETLYRESLKERGVREDRSMDDSTGDSNIFQYEVTLSELDADTKYYYVVYDGSRRISGEHRFTTSPVRGSDASTRIWVVGDSGTGGAAQREVYEAMQGFVKESGREMDFFVHVGDMAYSVGANFEFQNHFFDVYEDFLRETVVWPTMGNHEGYTSRGMTGIGPYYDAYVLPTNGEAGGVASGTEAYYSFDVGNVHFVCLDSHDLDRDRTGPMATWLVEDLKQTTANWLIAFWHHPPYTKGSHDSDTERQLIEMREEIMPILEARGVDLVLTGHSHIYERSMLMDGAYATPTVADGVILDGGNGDPAGDGAYKKGAGLNPHEGTVQVVAGNGGAGFNRGGGSMSVMQKSMLEHGSVVLDIHGDRLVGHMVNTDGVKRDIFSVVKRGRAKK